MSKISKEKEEKLKQHQLRELLEYNELTGEFKWRLKYARIITVGSIAGSFKKTSGEVIISIRNESYSAHRLAWLYVYGEFPKRGVEHINGDKKDNRISNLRQKDLVGENGKLSKRGVSRNFISGVEQALFGNKDIDITINWDKISLQAKSRVVEVKCNKCGNIENRLTSNLAAGKYLCFGCSRIRYAEQADFIGVDFVSHKGNDVYVACRCCKSIIKSSTGALRKQMSPRCMVCAENKCIASSNLRGFDYLGTRSDPDKPHNVVAVKCRKDGNEVLLRMSQLIAGSINCTECRLNRYKVALAEKGCSLIDIATDGICSTTYKTPSGDIFTARGNKVLRGDFKIDELGHWYNCHSVYLIINCFNNSMHYKIGTAITPTKRLKQLKLLGNNRVFTLESFSDRFGADNLEKELHREFAQFKLDPEVAKLFTGNNLYRKRVGVRERVGVKDGVHEWFVGDEVFQTLVTRYNLKEELNGTNGNPTNQVNYSG